MREPSPEDLELIEQIRKDVLREQVMNAPSVEIRVELAENQLPGVTKIYGCQVQRWAKTKNRTPRVFSFYPLDVELPLQVLAVGRPVIDASRNYDFWDDQRTRNEHD